MELELVRDVCWSLQTYLLVRYRWVFRLVWVISISRNNWDIAEQLCRYDSCHALGCPALGWKKNSRRKHSHYKLCLILATPLHLNVRRTVTALPTYHECFSYVHILFLPSFLTELIHQRLKFWILGEKALRVCLVCEPSSFGLHFPAI